MNDGEIAIIDLQDGLQIKTIENESQVPFIQNLEMEIEQLEKSIIANAWSKSCHAIPRSIAHAGSCGAVPIDWKSRVALGSRGSQLRATSSRCWNWRLRLNSDS